MFIGNSTETALFTLISAALITGAATFLLNAITRKRKALLHDRLLWRIQVLRSRLNRVLGTGRVSLACEDRALVLAIDIAELEQALKRGGAHSASLNKVTEALPDLEQRVGQFISRENLLDCFRPPFPRKNREIV